MRVRGVFFHHIRNTVTHTFVEGRTTIRQFKDRVAAFLRYRRVTANLDSRFPDATAEDSDLEDTCVVCREKTMPDTPDGVNANTEANAAKKLPCSHSFHLHCLRSWL